MRLWTIQIRFNNTDADTARLGKRWTSDKPPEVNFECRFAEFHSYADKIDVSIQWGVNDSLCIQVIEETVVEAEEDT